MRVELLAGLVARVGRGLRTLTTTSPSVSSLVGDSEASSPLRRRRLRRRLTAIAWSELSPASFVVACSDTSATSVLVSASSVLVDVLDRRPRRPRPFDFSASAGVLGGDFGGALGGAFGGGA